MDWHQYNVHWQLGVVKGKTGVTALSKEDAKATFEKYAAVDSPTNSRAYPFESKVIKVIGPLGVHTSTNKQKLAQRYGYLQGSIMGARTTFAATFQYMQTSDPKITRARDLVNTQIMKLQRDIRDCFRLAGLKIK